MTQPIDFLENRERERSRSPRAWELGFVGLTCVYKRSLFFTVSGEPFSLRAPLFGVRPASPQEELCHGCPLFSNARSSFSGHSKYC